MTETTKILIVVIIVITCCVILSAKLSQIEKLICAKIILGSIPEEDTAEMAKEIMAETGIDINNGKIVQEIKAPEMMEYEVGTPEHELYQVLKAHLNSGARLLKIGPGERDTIITLTFEKENKK